MNHNDFADTTTKRSKVEAHLPGIYFVIDLSDDGQLTFNHISDSVESILGWTIDDVTSPDFDFVALIDPPQRALLRDAIAVSAANLTKLTQQVRVRTKCGHIKWISFSASPGRTPAKSVTWHGVGIDISEYMTAHMSLADAVERSVDLETIISRGPAMAFIWRHATGWPVEYVTDNIRQFGYTPEQLISGDVSWPGIIHPDDLPRILEEVQQHLHDRSDEFSQRYRLIAADGQVRWIEDRTFAVRDASGALTHFQGVVVDVTEREQAMEAMHESRRLAKQIADTTPLMIFVWDVENWRPVYQNPQVQLQLGFTDEQWARVAEQPGFTTHPDDREIEQQFVADCMATQDGQVAEAEFRCKVRDEYRWFSVRGVAFERDPDGRTTKTLVTSMDITEQREAAATIRANEQMFRSMLKAVPDVVFIFDADARYLSVFTDKPHLLLDSPERLIGLTVHDILPCAIATEVHAVIRRALETGELQKYDFELTIKGKSQWFSCGVVSLGTPDEPRVLWVGRDETRQRQMQLQVEAHQRQLESLASQLTLAEERERRRISTDLHDRIGQTLSLAQIKLGGIDDSQLTEADRGALHDSVKLVSQTILDARSLMFELSPPILYDLGLEAAVEWLADHHRDEHDLAVELKLSDTPLPFDETTAVLLFRVVRELAVNVVKHAKASKMEISIEQRGDRAWITVSDDGVGMPTGTIHAGRGNGLHFGLFNIRQQIERLGGKVNINTQPGQGTSISIDSLLQLPAG